MDRDAMEPKAASKGNEADDDADDLAAMFGSLGVSNAKRCQVCQTEYALFPSCRRLAQRHADVSALRLPSFTTGSHCADCAVLADKARPKSLAGPSDLPPDSAKIRKILELLRKVDERDDMEKTIIFSQFTSMLDLIQPFLNAKGIKHVRCKCLYFLLRVLREGSRVDIHI
jgi:SNF2 family DNA or RNA helicase